MPDKEERNRIIRTHQKREAQTERRHLYSFDMSCHNMWITLLKKNPDENMSFAIIAGQATRNSPIIWAAFICCCSPWWWMEMASENQQTVRRSAAQTEQLEKGPRNVWRCYCRRKKNKIENMFSIFCPVQRYNTRSVEKTKPK